jgi:hypothetical protein
MEKTMAREFTPNELKAWSDVESTLATKGLVIFAEDGKEEMDSNSAKIIGYYEANPNVEMTARSITEAVELLREQLKWLSQAEMEYNRAYRALSKADQDSFGAWWYAKASRYIETDSGNGFSNATKILNWMKGRTFSNQNFNLAISNLTWSKGLYLAPVRSVVRQGHESDGKPFAPKDDVNVSIRERARQQREAAALRAGKPAERTEPDYKKLADEIVGHTHSQTATIRKTFVTKPGTSDIDWEKTLYSRRRMAGL